MPRRPNDARSGFAADVLRARRRSVGNYYGGRKGCEYFMVRHIVMWRLEDTPERAIKAAAIKEGLEALKDKIEEIADIEVGINMNDTDTVSDVVLVSTFATHDDLAAYIRHPAHKAVGASAVKPYVIERRVVDYEF